MKSNTLATDFFRFLKRPLNKWATRVAAGVAITGVVVLVLGAISYAAGARINITRSVPVGLYWTSNAPVEKGATVTFCPPRSAVFDEAKRRGYIGTGFCPGRYQGMMKRVLATKGDIVTISEAGVSVNGELLPFSKPRLVDGVGQPLPRLQLDRYRLGPADVLLMSDVIATSFDARYFGLIHRSHIQTVVRPVITW